MSFETIRYDSNYQEAVIDLWEKCSLIVPSNSPIEEVRKNNVSATEFYKHLGFRENNVVGLGMRLK